MIPIRKIFLVLFVSLSFISVANSNEIISYLDVDSLLEISKPGKKIITTLSELNEKNKSTLKLAEKKLRSLEENINKQKNIMSEDEIKIKIQNLQNEFANYKENKDKLINDFNNKKNESIKLFFEKATPLIKEYIDKKNISVVLDKKNIFLANNKNDITADIIKIINENIK